MSKKLKPDIKGSKHKWQLFSNLPEISGPMIRICGNKEVAVDGCKGVVDYYENMIKLRLPKGFITFSGTELAIIAFTEDSAVISGCVHTIDFSVT